MAIENEIKNKHIKLKNDDNYIVIPDVCGPGWWKILHNTVDAIYTDGCSNCGEHAIKLMSFMHDLVNVDLNKKVHDPANVLGFKQLVEKTFKQAEKQIDTNDSKVVIKAKQILSEKNDIAVQSKSSSLETAILCNSSLIKG